MDFYDCVSQAWLSELRKYSESIKSSIKMLEEILV